MTNNCGRSFGDVSSPGEQKVADVMYFYLPANGGSFSISTFSVTTNLLLRCFRGGLPTMGIMSFGPRMRFNGVVRGGVVME